LPKSGPGGRPRTAGPGGARGVAEAGWARLRARGRLPLGRGAALAVAVCDLPKFSNFTDVGDAE